MNFLFKKRKSLRHNWIGNSWVRERGAKPTRSHVNGKQPGLKEIRGVPKATEMSEL